jgi:MFS family permease
MMATRARYRATAAAFTYPIVLVVRFLFGVGEAGAWPCVARTFSRWIPRSERGRAQGIFFAGAHLVAGLTPAVIVGGGLLGGWWPGAACWTAIDPRRPVFGAEPQTLEPQATLAPMNVR